MAATCGAPRATGQDRSSCVDDFLLTPPNVIEAKDLLEVIDDRSQLRSTLVVSQLPVENWHPALADGDPIMADAILDRLVHNAHRLTLEGLHARTSARGGMSPNTHKRLFRNSGEFGPEATTAGTPALRKRRMLWLTRRLHQKRYRWRIRQG
jgi:hypothetical protein